ncbi:MAG: protein kinase [Acidobacteriota bacterium]
MEKPTEIGPFRILRTLGEGGMGIVYQAFHPKTARQFALKTVRLPDASILCGIRREIRALAELSHPGIVRIVAEGIHDGMPWYAMDLAPGTTLAAFIADLRIGVADLAPVAESQEWTAALPRPGTASFPLPRIDPAPRAPGRKPPAGAGALTALLTLVRRLCHPLSYLHGEGLVHRDLKPGNVLVRADGVPVIIDFGLISRFHGTLGREALEASGSIVGTMGYIAPEQARGEIVDARADLYALGCILYEVIAGRPPFMGQPASVLMQHLGAAPVPPSSHVEGVPPELDALVLRLLAKEARTRPGYAEDVARILGELGAENGAFADAPRPRTHVYRPGFAGREDELGTLEREREAVVRGGFRLALIQGEAGVGKTRLGIELSRRAACDMLVVMTRCDPESRAPLSCLRGLFDVIADRCREKGPAATARILGRRGPVLAPYAPAIADLPGQDPRASAPELPEDEGRLRALLDLATCVRELRDDFGLPLFVLVDDLQWADDLTAAFLESLVRLAPPRIYVVATLRSEEAGALPVHLRRASEVVDVTLGRMGPSHVAAIARDMLAMDDAPPALAEYVHRRSEGNALFAAECVRTAVEQGVLRRDRDGDWVIQSGGAATGADLPLPRSCEDLLASRIARLAPGPRRVLDAAAVLGREMPADLLEIVAMSTGGEPAGDVQELISRHILEGVGPWLRFTHDKLREISCLELGEDDRRRLHLASARGLERLYGKTSDAHRGVAGHHWERAGELDAARECYLAAARSSAARYAHVDAERFLRSYLALSPHARSSFEARLELAEQVRSQPGRFADAAGEAQAALALAETLGEEARGRALLALGGLAFRAGEPGQARALYDRALACAKRAVDRPLEARVLCSLGSLPPEAGASDDLSQLASAIAMVRELGDRASLVNALNNLARREQIHGRADAARARFQEALEIAREMGERRTEGAILSNLAGLDASDGLPGAAALYEASLGIADEIGDRRLTGVVLLNLGAWLALDDRADEARIQYEKALALFQETGDRDREASTLGNLAFVSLELGDLEAARVMFESARTVLGQVGNQVHEVTSILGLARCAHLATHPDAAVDALLARAEAICVASGYRRGLGLVASLRGHVALARGEGAEQHLSRAKEILAELGQGDRSHLGKDVACLERALRSAGPRLRGYCESDLSPALAERVRAAAPAP